MQLITDGSDDVVTRVALVGRLDVAGQQAIDETFHVALATEAKPAIVDCRRLEYVASLGMGMLFSCAHSLKTRGHRMVLLAPPDEVAEALRMAGLDQAAPIVDDEAEGLAALGL